MCVASGECPPAEVAEVPSGQEVVQAKQAGLQPQGPAHEENPVVLPGKRNWTILASLAGIKLKVLTGTIPDAA